MPRILIVEDSPTASLLLESILTSDPNNQIVGKAKNGEEGLSLALKLKPDLITIDIHMPGMNGLELTRQIMAQIPTPIVIVSSSVNPGEVKLSFQAIQAGALVILQKPSGPAHPQYARQASELLRTVRLMADIKVFKRRIKRSIPIPPSPVIPRAAQEIKVIAICASTGGPAALAHILLQLPKDIPVPIMIVQHIAENFDRGFADWLSTTTGFTCALARDGQRMSAGEVLLAPHGSHLGVNSSKRVVLDQSDPIGEFRPSATYLFQSVSRVYGPHALAVILTGMGRDGALGLSDFHQNGGYVIAQDEISCIVYGMPKEAVALGTVDCILPLEKIPTALKELVCKG